MHFYTIFNIIAITSLLSVKQANKKANVVDYADVILDNFAPVGDCTINIADGEFPTGPTSSISTAFIINNIVIKSISMLLEKGIKPPVMHSVNKPGGKEYNENLIEKFKDKFPSAETRDNNYRIKGNDDWTNGFWTGMQAISYEYTHEPAFLNNMLNNVESFKQRLIDHFVLDHHDIGFLYSPSVVACWDITKQDDLKPVILAATDKLVARFHPDAGFIQAWGALDNANEYRLIIDSLINLPLLYKAYQISHDSHYENVANRHFNTVIKHIFRSDYSSHHTFYFDIATQQPLYGKTFQGFSDKSCWARGQAWAVLGLPLNWKLNGLVKNKILYQHITDYFLTRLPEDGVPYWDLSFTEQDHQPRDTSALAIAICGLYEAAKVFPDENYAELAAILLKKLVLFNAKDEKENEHTDGILRHGVYAFAENKGVDECNLWGDYFYMESLYRFINHNWQGYWS